MQIAPPAVGYPAVGVKNVLNRRLSGTPGGVGSVAKHSPTSPGFISKNIPRQPRYCCGAAQQLNHNMI